MEEPTLLVKVLKKWEIGYVKVVSKINAIAVLVMTVGIFIKTRFGFDVSLLNLVVLGVLISFGVFVVGHLYDKLGLYEQESMFDILRNPALREIISEENK